ncbi:hypothetical protein JAAARDRAFT_30695 [Jaapia argillacea MUCL 33604]|uniref:Hydrophobin n=1 Tax=Jaapia argillacea MUCL 33604 TaxID=933084 RepID=A0A067QJJ2_9AGAM|nr:hypothetical protein JAAARDRAFT_30695 [Jaapia argillacea MUCL 33604]
MFSKITVVATATLSVLVAVTPAFAQCNTGPMQCCNSVQKADDPSTAALCKYVGIDTQNVNGLVGVNCSPITAVDVGSGSSCNAQPVCCEDNSYGTLISIGCVVVEL